MIRSTSMILAATLLWIPVFASNAAAQLMQDKLVPFDGDPGDRFGWRVAHVPGWAFVGSNLDDDVQDVSGAVYVYESVGGQWTFRQKIKMPEPGFGDQFGYDVAASNDWMVATAWNADPGGILEAGSAQVYLNVGGVWTHHQELVASDFASGLTDRFGESSAMHGDVLLIGMPRDNFKTVVSGSFYVFELQGSTWVETAKLAPSSPEDWEIGCSFGAALDVEGDVVVVGAPFLDEGGSNRGAAFVFERSGGSWVQTQKLVPDDPKNSDNFGTSVAISGDTILIGADGHKHSSPANMQGAVYVFTKTGDSWMQTQELIVNDPWNPLGLGDWVDMEGDLAVFGVGGDNDLGSGSGSAYVFRRFGTQWEQIGKLLAPDGDPGDVFGGDARIAGNTVLCSAYVDDDACNDEWQCNVGAAYVFEIAPDTRQYSSCSISGPCGNHDDHGGCANSTTVPGTGFFGQGAVLAAAGTTSVVSDSLKLETRWLPPNVLGILFMGGATNWLPFGDGRLVVGSGGLGVFRFLPPQSSGAQGAMLWAGGLVQQSQAMPPQAYIDAGETWYFQTWYRDPTGPCGSGFNTTNGLKIDFTP
jgi:hypothetical protein